MNPYSPPVAQGPYPAAPPPGAYSPPGAVSEIAIEMLRQTRPWVLFLGILSFVFAGFMALGAFGVLIAGLAASATTRGGGASAALALVYLPLAAIYIYPGIKLVRYGSAIGRLLQSRGSPDLEDALAQQKGFWRFSGVAAIVMIVLYVVMFIVILALGASMARLFT